jgi:hypothetical protein
VSLPVSPSFHCSFVLPVCFRTSIFTNLNIECQKEVDQLQDELGKKAYLAQANLKTIVDKFRDKTKTEIKVATTMTL